MTPGSFEISARRTLGRGSLVDLEEVTVRTPSGREMVRDVVRHPGGVAVLAIDEDRVWLIRQHRVALGRDLVEIPAGKLDRTGESVEAAARRELGEELGATAAVMEHLATMAPSPGYTDEVIEIYLAQGLHFSDRRPDGEEEQEAHIFSMPIAEALNSIDNGQMIDAKTQVALLSWKRRRG